MYTLLVTVHIANCLLLVLVVLLQAGRGAGLAVFGGGGGDLLTTPSGTTFMKKFTSWLAITFAITSLLLTLVSGRSGLRSVTGSMAAPPAAAPQAPQTQTPAPAAAQPVPAAPPAAPAGKGAKGR